MCNRRGMRAQRQTVSPHSDAVICTIRLHDTAIPVKRYHHSGKLNISHCGYSLYATGCRLFIARIPRRRYHPSYGYYRAHLRVIKGKGFALATPALDYSLHSLYLQSRGMFPIVYMYPYVMQVSNFSDMGLPASGRYPIKNWWYH